jgi:SHS2 domain-containing protein
VAYRWVDHTAELELVIEAQSEREVFDDALAALGELLGTSDASGTRRVSATAGQKRRVSATASDRPALLAAWMEELVFLAESDGFVAAQLDDLALRDEDLTANVSGAVGEPPPLVKAVTYHNLVFEPTADGYVARVVLDV